MVLLLVFAVLLLAAVLLSSLAKRTVLSTAALFFLAGFLLGDGSLGVLRIEADDELVSGLAELALFSILFSDGMRTGVRDIGAAWRLPGRALGLGFPLTFIATGTGGPGPARGGHQRGDAVRRHEDHATGRALRAPTARRRINGRWWILCR